MTEKQKKSTNENLDSIDTLLFDLKKSIKAKELVVFCGAGISFYSGLPLANDLVRYVLEKLSVSEEETKTIINSNLPFEAFIETLRGNSEVDRIFDVFGLGEPNTSHFLLAKLAKAKYVKTICTTNFDQLIEKAFESEGLIREDDFQVFYKESDLDNIDWDDNKVRLIKIHGSVEDKANMAITLQQVASEKMSAQKMSVIEHIFSKGAHKGVLVLGYSCSDVFDISPQIEGIRKKHKDVIFIDHCEKERAAKDIKDKKEKNPFQNFAGSKWVLYNTDDLVKVLWDICEPKDDYLFQEITKDNTLWKKCVEDWFLETEDNYTSAAKYIIVGEIFYKISGSISAAVYYVRALSIAREIGNKRSEGKCLGYLGIAYGDLGNNQKAIGFFKQALSIARKIGDKGEEGAWLRNLGSYYFRLGNYQRSIEFTEKALNIAREIGGSEYEEGSCLHNLGSNYSLLGDYKKGIMFTEQSLSIARKIGDKLGEVQCLGSLGSDYFRLGNYQKSNEFTEKALSIAREIGNKRSEGSCLNGLGNSYGILGDYQKAIEFKEQALSIAREIRDKKQEGDILGDLGDSYEILGDYQKAIDFNEQGLSIAIEIRDKLGEGNRLGDRGTIYFNHGDYQKAIELFEQALLIKRELGYKHGEGTILGNLGNSYGILA